LQGIAEARADWERKVPIWEADPANRKCV